MSYREMTSNFLRTKSEKDFTTLFYRIKPGLTSYINKIVKDQEIAEDIAVNTLTKMWTKIDQYDPQYQITTWLYRIAFNESLAYLNKRNKTSSLDQLSEFGVEVNMSGTIDINNLIIGVEMNTEQDFIDEDDAIMEKYTKALNAIQGLKGMYKEIMIDRLINNMKYDDIAEKHNINLQTVKNRIRRGKAIIIEEIEY